jgi:hypothetical protein
MGNTNVSQQWRYHGAMKPTTILPVRSNEPEFRRAHAEFIRRGLVAIRRTLEAGDGIPAEIVISKLRSKVSEAHRKRTPPA